MKNISTSVKRKPKAISSQCKICGASARYSYFSVISCQSCKVFFRRNAQNVKVSFFLFCNFNLIICLEIFKM